MHILHFYSVGQTCKNCLSFLLQTSTIFLKFLCFLLIWANFMGLYLDIWWLMSWFLGAGHIWCMAYSNRWYLELMVLWVLSAKMDEMVMIFIMSDAIWKIQIVLKNTMPHFKQLVSKIVVFHLYWFSKIFKRCPLAAKWTLVSFKLAI